MNKCKWKDGKFTPCKGFSPGVRIMWNVGTEVYDVECTCCGFSVSKPKPPEPIIKTSGETYVARFNGVDYLCLDPKEHESLVGTLEEGEGVEGIIKHFVYVWKPFSEIEITDEIAKLRPMVVYQEGNEPRILLAVEPMNHAKYVIEYGYTHSIVRIATVEDL